MSHHHAVAAGFWTKTVLLAAVAAVPLVVPASSLAQGLAAGPKEPSKSTLSVFVPDSSVAIERFNLADKLEKAREWGKASEIYQELLDNYRDRVVEAQGQAADQGIYISVSARVLEHVSRWPQEGLAIYNGRYEPSASQLLQQAQNESDLRAIANRYLLTRSGRIAAQRLMQIWWDRGDSSAVARLGQSLLGVSPADARPHLLFASALAWKLAGNSEQARLLLAELKKDYPNAQGEAAGQQVDLAAELEKAIGQSRTVHSTGGAWRQFGGSVERSAVPAAAGRSDALLFSIDLGTGTKSDPRQIPMPPRRARNLLGQALGVFPVHDGRELFFHDGAKLYGVSMDGGMKLPGWSASSVQISPTRTADPSLRSLALSQDKVFVVSSELPSTFPMHMGRSPASDDASGLACVDRVSGKIVWRFRPSTLSAQALKTCRIASPPLLVGDRLFVAARGGKDSQFSDIYVLCIACDSGKLLWHSYVASGPSVNAVIADESGTPAEAGLPQLSYHAGRLLVVTNVGAVAAMEATDGTPAWLRVYPRLQATSARWGIFPGAVPRHPPTSSGPGIFASSPAIVADGKAFVLPLDGRSLLVLDESTGQSIKEISRESLNQVDSLIGRLGDQVVLSSDRVAMVLDWKKADPNARDQKKAINWTMSLPTTSSVGFRGRPFLTADSLYLTTDERLMRVSTRNWKIEQMTPRYPATWDSAEGPGNVLVSDENVVIATEKRVNVYTNLQAATARLDREVQASPNSPEPLVRYCELLLAAGQAPEALAKLQAAAAVGRSQQDLPAATRDRLFSSALVSAGRLGASEETSQQSLAKQFMEVAGQVIATPLHAAQHRFAAAAMEARQGNDAGVLAQLQAVLNDPKIRSVLYCDLDGQMRYASEVARRRIADLVARRGREVYRPTEQKALQQVSAAQSAGDVAALLETARRYPNSSAAPAALLAAARLQEEARFLPEAATTLRQLVQDYPNHPDAAAFTEALARVYAGIPGKAHIAAARLAQAAATMSDPILQSPLRLPDGQVVPQGKFSEAAKALRSMVGSERVRPLPDFRLPPQGRAAFDSPRVLEGVAAETILSPIPGTPPDYRRVVVLSPAKELIVLNEAGKPLARFAAPTAVPAADYVWCGSSGLLVRAGRELAMLDVEKGSVTWRVDITALPQAAAIPEEAVPLESEDAEQDPTGMMAPNAGVVIPQGRVNMRVVLAGRGAAPAERPQEPLPELRDVAVTSRAILFGTASGRLAAVDVSNGKLLWQIQSDGMAIARVAACDDFSAATLNSPARSAILAIDNDTGRLLFRRTFAADVVQNLALSSDGKLVFTQPGRLVCKDLFDQSDRMLFEVPATREEAYAGLSRADQLLVTDNAIIAAADGGAFVRTYSLFTGQQFIPGGRNMGDVATLAVRREVARGPATATHLILAEPYLYAWSGTTIRAANLLRIESPDRGTHLNLQNLQQIIAGTGHLIALDTPARRGDAPIPSLGFVAFSRAATKSGESGRVDHYTELKFDAGITGWQMTEGGLYVMTADNRLSLLPIAK